MAETSAPTGASPAKNREPRTWVWGRPWTRWRTVRLALLLVWFCALLLWGFTRLRALLLPVEILSAVVFLVLLWPWVRGPYLLYTRRSVPLHAGFEVRSNLEAVEFAHELLDLRKLGFEFAGVVSNGSGPNRVKVEAVICLHPANKDSVQIARVTSRIRVVHSIIFKTRFDDGFAFETSNSHTPPIIRPDPQFKVFRFPDLRSRADLYRIHQKLKERFADNRRAVIADNAGEIAEFIARSEIAHQRRLERDYKLDAAAERYVYTIRGAIRHAWLHTWPVKFIRQMRLASQAMRTARELGLPINPKFGRLEDSVRRGDL